MQILIILIGWKRTVKKMGIERSLAYEAKRRFCYIELEKWKFYLCEKRHLNEVEIAIANTCEIINEIRRLDDVIYSENMPPCDDPLN